MENPFGLTGIVSRVYHPSAAAVVPATKIVETTPAIATVVKKQNPKPTTIRGSVSVDTDVNANPSRKKRKVSPAKDKGEPEPVGDGKGRCTWASNPRYPLLQQYHDTEWCMSGGFNRTNRYLFEMIILEGK